MKYKKIIDLLDNTLNQPSKFRTKGWVEINHDSRGKYNTKSQFICKTSMLTSILWVYCDGYILVKESITIPNTEAAGAVPNNRNKKNI